MNVKAKVDFWEAEAKRTLIVAEDLIALKHYLEGLFFGRLALEKLLKAKIVVTVQPLEAPRRHCERPKGAKQSRF